MKNRFAGSEEEAQDRFNKYAKLDPFPEIQPALLNSADILDYIAETGMIYPFHEKEMKSASYEVGLLGKVIYWDENGNKISREINRGEEFTLIKNSIAFVTPEPTFRIPEYIALRFNLKITYVHRGILLGTGPLVDPGYEGKLLIPLHNLTTNDYKFKGGEGLIWVEFTKLSENKQRWTKLSAVETTIREGEYVPFPESKKKQEPEFFIAKALKDQDHNSIRSSIPDVVRQAKEEAQKAREEAQKAGGEAKASARSAESMNKRATIISLLALLALAVALATLVCTIYQSFTGVTSLITDTRANLESIKSGLDDRIRSQNEEIKVLKTEIDILKGKSEKHSPQSKQIQPPSPAGSEPKK
jgi:deoxycytidine triphosphate deaminase